MTRGGLEHAQSLPRPGPTTTASIRGSHSATSAKARSAARARRASRRDRFRSLAAAGWEEASAALPPGLRPPGLRPPGLRPPGRLHSRAGGLAHVRVDDELRGVGLDHGRGGRRRRRARGRRRIAARPSRRSTARPYSAHPPIPPPSRGGPCARSGRAARGGTVARRPRRTSGTRTGVAAGVRVGRRRIGRRPPRRERWWWAARARASCGGRETRGAARGGARGRAGRGATSRGACDAAATEAPRRVSKPRVSSRCSERAMQYPAKHVRRFAMNPLKAIRAPSIDSLNNTPPLSRPSSAAIATRGASLARLDPADAPASARRCLAPPLPPPPTASPRARAAPRRAPARAPRPRRPPGRDRDHARGVPTPPASPPASEHALPIYKTWPGNDVRPPSPHTP